MNRCEDYPCCGHELGDCDGSKYGSDESIMSSPHVLCDHEFGECLVWEAEEGDYCRRCGGDLEDDEVCDCVDDATL